MSLAPTPIRSSVAAIPATDLSPAQKAKIRGLLDTNFDDALGAYLDDMTDAKIAETVGVPRIHVERMRETAYGPIRISPEMVELTKELMALTKEIESQRGGLDNLKARVSVALDKAKRLTG